MMQAAMVTDKHRRVGPLLIGGGVCAQSIGISLLLLATMAVFGLDRSGYPVVSGLGHPAWILLGALLVAIGGLVTGYGYFLVLRLLVQINPTRSAVPPASV